ncbi:MAG TPA: protease pro-enzyme activation domain-containing protein [Patescibacteria group bacterium]|jgi:hypothetical protein|nr:protease pro-enzyme activation domain-containing protein [Patescibacteria group bacterium]
MSIFRLLILGLILLFAAASGAHAQDDTIELPDNVPAVIINGTASYYDSYGPEKALHLTVNLYDSGFNQDEKSSLVAKWLRDNGMKNVTESKDHLAIDADTDVQTVATVFGIAIDQYGIGTILYYSNSKPPNIPIVLNGIIKKIDGLDSFQSEMR